MASMLVAWMHIRTSVNMSSALEKMGYNKCFADWQFCLYAKNRSSALGSHEEEMVTDSTGTHQSECDAAPAGGNDPCEQWHDEENDELRILTSLLADGSPPDQDTYFGHSEEVE